MRSHESYFANCQLNIEHFHVNLEIAVSIEKPQQLKSFYSQENNKKKTLTRQYYFALSNKLYA